MDASFWRETFEAALRITRAWRAEQAHSETLLAAAIEFDGRLTLLGPSAHRTRPEALGALLRTGDVAAIDALRARHERGLSNLRTALNTSVERFGALQLEAAALHGRSWERYTRLQHSLPQEEALALASEPASVVIGAGRGVLAEQGLLPEAPTLLGWLRDASASLDARIPTPGSRLCRGQGSRRPLSVRASLPSPVQVDRALSREMELKLRLLPLLAPSARGDATPGFLARAARLWCLQPALDRRALERLSFAASSLAVEE
ncbi:hypothetical protein EMIHUDRAFT_206980 [Emiliania huxleyi CCMP1516]|uniref:Uncharacterized protein n=2 Tax=Emiliania huxleyi TaxID=2903 RepID=A0A0D3JKD8_EMIH1|nr:hypothetical protein EMIHUDRAFT_246293 [Emiliania huxleyi CCMP1516]XP_005776402.1 hypothetical protein EMIHUDRAFT_206980 [Emiliania huxleyi CCMP1516]EOD14277.1 hypothetical protein EMIHUDRAFT_246293 [Emiliania huxleyi CCMP1516]EOD23973.1 hypothetical protein EMIHUDRAFT_206980 [Emiliania huxleyi CCMP1516]|eukprot:XP_005766706.1 hypothetical protein EMIHUDRAFT_246293 [Emiliania huxleyi CCMP1516]